jgi:hypothetical protein
MPYEHPHVQASYRIVAREDMTFAVEVSVPGTSPTMISGLSTEAKAEEWITRHKAQVAKGTIYRRSGFSGPKKRPR